MNGFEGMGLGMIWFRVIGILILLLIIWFIARSFNQNTSDNRNKSVLDILKERYAKGEINIQEFEVEKKDLL